MKVVDSASDGNSGVGQGAQRLEPAEASLASVRRAQSIRTLYGALFLGMQIPSRRPRRSARQIKDLLDALRSSGLFEAAFSRQHGTAQSRLSVHLKKAGHTSTHPRQKLLRLLEVELSTPGPEPAGYRMSFPCGLLLDIARHFQPAQLSVILRGVAGAGLQPCPL